MKNQLIWLWCLKARCSMNLFPSWTVTFRVLKLGQNAKFSHSFPFFFLDYFKTKSGVSTSLSGILYLIPSFNEQNLYWNSNNKTLFKVSAIETNHSSILVRYFQVTKKLSLWRNYKAKSSVNCAVWKKTNIIVRSKFSVIKRGIQKQQVNVYQQLLHDDEVYPLHQLSGCLQHAPVLSEARNHNSATDRLLCDSLIPTAVSANKTNVKFGAVKPLSSQFYSHWFSHAHLGFQRRVLQHSLDTFRFNTSNLYILYRMHL